MRIASLLVLGTLSLVATGCSKVPSECRQALEMMERMRVALGQPRGVNDTLKEQIELMSELDPAQARALCTKGLQTLSRSHSDDDKGGENLRLRARYVGAE